MQEMEIFDAPSWKRLVDGRQLTKALDAEPGRWMMAALQICMAWQFRNPKETDPTGAIEEVKSKSEELQIPFKRTASKGEKRVDVNGNNVAL
jgi:tRNA nucleotidyltransferase (CCA-adding enzyme)